MSASSRSRSTETRDLDERRSGEFHEVLVLGIAQTGRRHLWLIAVHRACCCDCSEERFAATVTGPSSEFRAPQDTFELFSQQWRKDRREARLSHGSNQESWCGVLSTDEGRDEDAGIDDGVDQAREARTARTSETASASASASSRPPCA